MSSKVTIRLSDGKLGSLGYHLYRDVFHVELPVGEEGRAVFLELRGVTLMEMSSDMSRGGVDLTVAMSEKLAKELGLIKAGD